MQIDRDLFIEALNQSRMRVLLRGHTWDIADILDALDQATVAQSAEATDLKSES